MNDSVHLPSHAEEVHFRLEFAFTWWDRLINNHFPLFCSEEEILQINPRLINTNNQLKFLQNYRLKMSRNVKILNNHNHNNSNHTGLS